ncbi:MAG TPA: pyrroline-5-carboxylate reductase [Bacteroidales bacterium]|jgi:pyrroline-5-carboxylate reductase
MKDLKFAIIGAGNIGSAIVEGFLKTGIIKAENIYITDQRTEPLDYFKTKGLSTGKDNDKAVSFADIVIVAVKPYIVKSVLEEIKTKLVPSRHLLISIAAGISIKNIEDVTGRIPIFRTIPNTAIAVQESMTFITEANSTKEQQEIVQKIFNQLGNTMFIPEDMMNAATVIGSCGTAFVMRFIRASVEGGVQIGFKPEVAQQIISQTALGAAKLLLETGGHPEHEIDKVATPNGMSIMGLNEMEHNGFTSSVIKGIMAAFHKVSR